MVAPLKSAWQLSKGYRDKYAAGLIILVFCNLLDLLPPFLIMWAVDALTKTKNYTQVWQIAVGLVVLSVVLGAARYGWRYFVVGSGARISTDVRESLYKHMQRLPPLQLGGLRVGDLLSRNTFDVGVIRQGMSYGILMFIDSIIYIAIVPWLMFQMIPSVTLWVLLPMLALPFVVKAIDDVIDKYHQEVQEQQSRVADSAQELLNGYKVIKAFMIQRQTSLRFFQQCLGLANKNKKYAVVEAAFTPATEIIAVAAMLLCLWLVGKEVLAGAVTLGAFIAYQRLAQKLIWPMSHLGWSLTQLQRTRTSHERVKQVLALPTWDSHRNNEPLVAPRSAPLADAPLLEIKSLWWAYPSKSSVVINDLSFSVYAGQRIGIVGPVASGKSTLLQLISGLLPVSAGNIFLDGIDITSVDPQELRSKVSLVPQASFLFSRSVKDNVALGRAHSAGLTSREFWDVLKSCSIETEVADMPQAEHTVVGERGVSLSGGQRQRLTIARALVADRKIILLDDCLSAVDPDTERVIIEGIRQLDKSVTVLIATHRKDVLSICDRVITLNGPEVLCNL